MTKGLYDREPAVSIKNHNEKAWRGYSAIIQELSGRIRACGKGRVIVAIDCYPGVDETELVRAFREGLSPCLVIDAGEANYSHDHISGILSRNITDDRVFGVLSCHTIDEFFDERGIERARSRIDEVRQGIVLVYGVGAALLHEPDILVYADMARWEIQTRMRRKEVANWCADNYNEDFLRKYKRAYFIDWRVIDRYKSRIIDRFDYYLDMNIRNDPKMITGSALTDGLRQTASRPFRLVPFFDPGPWGGQWMKEVCGLDPKERNYAWCFDCVPEENSLYLVYGDIRVEVPSINLVMQQPVALLGDKVHARFGTEFPIRFDFLDTMEGGNLSLQVHPLTEYIQQTFGMHYTQDESYYMLDAKPDACVYLGIKNDMDRNAMLHDLDQAQKGEIAFDADTYINRWPARKHDHFLIPAGTIHCSGKNSMVLEISATPYIFTFKLWDWGRLGLDGRPRPVHLEHGRNVIQWHRDTDWTKANLVNRIEKIAEGDGWVEERTGLHEREFIETRRHWFTKPVQHDTHGGVNVLNLIEGSEALVESPDNAFKPYVVHYAETFVIPACVGAYTIRPYGKGIGETIGTIKAYVRT